MMGTTANYQGTSNLGPFINTFDSQYSGATGESSTLSQLWDTTIRTNLLSYGSDISGKKDGIFQFNNVPNGLNENNLFSTTLMRMVSNKGPFEGNSAHPILIRSYDNNWSDELPKSEYGLKDEYDNTFGYLSDIQINIVATGLTYVVLIYGLNYFIIRKHKSVQEAALLGFFTYAVYELTNLSLFKKDE